MRPLFCFPSTVFQLQASLPMNFATIGPPRTLMSYIVQGTTNTLVGTSPKHRAPSGNVGQRCGASWSVVETSESVSSVSGACGTV